MKTLEREDYVREFHDAMGHSSDVKNPTERLLELRFRLISEEYEELKHELATAMAETHFKDGVTIKTKERILKELADLQYVISGMAVALGLPLQIAFIRVHKSNMSKLGDNGKPLYRDDGKVMKGPNYRPAHLEDLVE